MVEEVLKRYDVVIGLEVHAQLATKSKAYAADANEYGAAPNTLVSPITLGHPGTLPKANKRVIEYAVKLGLAVGSDIRRDMYYARKNYFYPDLPKGYQITQDLTPICNGGKITVTVDGKKKDIGITRIHMEEDAGKSIHDQDPFNTLVDLNRAGVPLVEIVSEPDIRSADEAYAYLTEVRRLVRYLEICDGNMEEGSLRCDANISIMPKGASEFGERVEVKNMNSIRNVSRAIAHEIVRQAEIYDNGGTISMETRNFNATDGSTSSLRSKEQAHDYRYFPEPDLQPLHVSQEYIDKIQADLPALPAELFERYTKDYGLTDYDANVLTDDKATAHYFEEILKHTESYKTATNWLMGPIRSHLNQMAIDIEEFELKPEQIADIIKAVESGKISNSNATQKVFPEMIKTGRAPIEIATELNLITETNEDEIIDIVRATIMSNPVQLEKYKSGNKGLMGFFMGEVMRETKGKADPKTASQLVKQILDES